MDTKEFTSPLPEFPEFAENLPEAYPEEKSSEAGKQHKKQSVQKKSNSLKYFMAVGAAAVIVTANSIPQNSVSGSGSDIWDSPPQDVVDVDNQGTNLPDGDVTGIPEEPETEQLQTKERIYIPELDEAYAALYGAVTSGDIASVESCVETYLDTIVTYHGGSEYLGVAFDGAHVFATFGRDDYETYGDYHFDGMVVELAMDTDWQGYDLYRFSIGVADYSQDILSQDRIFAVMNCSVAYSEELGDYDPNQYTVSMIGLLNLSADGAAQIVTDDEFSSEEWYTTNIRASESAYQNINGNSCYDYYPYGFTSHENTAGKRAEFNLDENGKFVFDEYMYDGGLMDGYEHNYDAMKVADAAAEGKPYIFTYDNEVYFTWNFSDVEGVETYSSFADTGDGLSLCDVDYVMYNIFLHMSQFETFTDNIQ